MLIVCLLAPALTAGPLAVSPAFSAGSIKPPKIELENIEVAHYWGFWHYSKKVEPTHGKPFEAGAPLDLAFVFNITNPNPFPVRLDELKFSIAFEGFDLNSVTAYETMWIPPVKTNQYRVHAMFDAATAFLSLGVTGGFKLKEMNVGPWEQLEKWWTGIQEFSFPIAVTNGTASFSSDGKSVIGTFNAVYPEPAKK